MRARSEPAPARNRHGTGTSWTLGRVTTILENPRYRGRQVWNRQRTDTELADPGNVTLGHKSVQRWNLPDGWVISNRPAHPPLVSEADFVAAQDVNAACGPAPQASPVLRQYLLAGLLACGVCGRRMESAWSNSKPAYRCRHGRTSAMAPDPAPAEEQLRPPGQAPDAPARSAPAAYQPCHPRPVPNPRRCGCQTSCEPWRGDRVPARTRDHPHLGPGRRGAASTRHRDRQDCHRESKLTEGRRSPCEEREKARNADRLAWAAAHRPGDDLACPETGEYGEIMCPRSESAATYIPALIGELVLGGAR